MVSYIYIRINLRIFIRDRCQTNSIHRQFRKLTKTKDAFPNENSLLKLLYMGIKNAEKNGFGANEMHREDTKNLNC